MKAFSSCRTVTEPHHAVVRNEREAIARPTAAVPERERVQEHAADADRGKQKEEGEVAKARCSSRPSFSYRRAYTCSYDMYLHGKERSFLNVNFWPVADVGRRRGVAVVDRKRGDAKANASLLFKDRGV